MFTLYPSSINRSIWKPSLYSSILEEPTFHILCFSSTNFEDPQEEADQETMGRRGQQALKGIGTTVGMGTAGAQIGLACGGLLGAMVGLAAGCVFGLVVVVVDNATLNEAGNTAQKMGGAAGLAEKMKTTYKEGLFKLCPQIWIACSSF